MGLGRNQRRAQSYREIRGNSKGYDNVNQNMGGVNCSKNVNNKATQILQYEEVIRGISYGKSGKKMKQRTRRQEEAETDSDDEEMTEAVQMQLVEIRKMEKSIRLGDMTKSRPDQVFRLMAGNVNNMVNKSVRQRKVCEIQQLIDQWDIQGVGISEVGIDFRKVSYDKNMASWFRANREKYRTSVAHNTRDPAVSVRVNQEE